MDKTGDELRRNRGRRSNASENGGLRGPRIRIHSGGVSMSFKIERRAYVDMFGPTTGDRVRLAGTGVNGRR